MDLHFGSFIHSHGKERNEGIDREGRAAQEGEKRKDAEREGEKEKYMDV